MTEAAPGSVVAFWDDRDLAVAVVAGEDKQRVRLILPGGREARVLPSRIAFHLESAARASGAGPASAGERAAAASARVRARAAALDVSLVWEILREVGRTHGIEALAELALGEDTGEARATVTRALLDDGQHFVRRAESWEARTPEAVAELRLQEERAKQRAAERHAALHALSAAVRGEAWLPTGSDAERRYLEAIEAVAVHDVEATDSAQSLAIEALDGARMAGDRPSERAFRLLRRIGRLGSDDENLLVRRHSLRMEFPAEVLAAARSAVLRGFSREGRIDLTGLVTVTIDSAYTREVDDALSVEKKGSGGWRLGVHIADPGAFIEAGDPVDVEAALRASSHYLPDLRLSMLPPEISEEAASLVAGAQRPALSFLADVDGEGRVVRSELVRSVIASSARLTYEEADGAIASGDGPFAATLGEWAAAARLLEARRVEAGAVILWAAEVDVHLGPDGRILLDRQDPRSPARRLVSEAMVLAGALAARFAVERGVPFLFRRQAAPSILPDVPPSGIEDPVILRTVRRSLRRGEVGLQPGRHFALGLDAYAQSTSPLRRYQDLVAHRQIAAVLEGRPPVHGPEEMQRIAATTETAEAEGRRAERSADLYWRLRYLEQQAKATVDGIVVDLRPIVVQLTETLLEEKVSGLVGAGLGQRVVLRVERVNPRAELLLLRPV